MTSEDLKRPLLTSKESSAEPVKPKKNKLEGAGKTEINGEFLDEILHKNTL